MPKNGKTITTRKIDVRSPEGKLLSSTIQKTVSFGKEAVLPPDPYSNGTSSTVTIGPVEHLGTSKRADDLISERTELVDLNLTRDCGDSTMYGDKWSEPGGTLIRRSRLIPNSCTQPNDDSFMADLIWEINSKRRLHHIPCLLPADRLMHRAQSHASQMATNRKIRLTDKMNIWIGRVIGPKRIADEWYSEMESWQKHYFKAVDLRLVGIGMAILDENSHKPLHLIVAIYE